MKLYITYKDDGPAGVCGQTVDITNPRSKLYVISGDNEERIREELKNLQESVNNLRSTRRNARLTDYYWEGNEWEQEDVKHISTESDVNSSDEIEVQFRSWYKEKYGIAYFGSVPLVVLIEWSKTLLNQTRIQQTSIEVRLRMVEDLAADAVAGMRYIEQSHGRLYGVGWDRVYKKADILKPTLDIYPESSNGWQPISTAPKDGTEIQVCDHNFIEIVSWCWDVGEGWIDRDGRFVTADWWRPLPNLPHHPH